MKDLSNWQCFGLVFGWLVFDILFWPIIIHSLPDANVKHAVVLFVAGWVGFLIYWIATFLRRRRS